MKRDESMALSFALTRSFTYELAFLPEDSAVGVGDEQPILYLGDKGAAKDPIRFDGHQVVSIEIRNRHELERLVAAVEIYNLDPWTPLRLGAVHLRLPPTFPPAVLGRTLSLPVTVIHADVQSLIDSIPTNFTSSSVSGSVEDDPSKDMSFFQEYHTWDEIANFTRSLAEAYPNIVKLISIGETYEGREILGVRIFGGKEGSDDSDDDSDDEKKKHHKHHKLHHKKHHKHHQKHHHPKNKMHGHYVYRPAAPVPKPSPLENYLPPETYLSSEDYVDPEDYMDSMPAIETGAPHEGEQVSKKPPPVPVVRLREFREEMREILGFDADTAVDEVEVEGVYLDEMEEDEEADEEIVGEEEEEEAEKSEGPNRRHGRTRYVRAGKRRADSRHIKEIAVVTYFMHQLATLYDRDHHVTRLVDAFEWTFVPVLNVDGYIYAHENNRMWRKNRQPTSFPFCYGIDTNRNWGYKWNNGGSSSNPCNEAYMGSEAFSAPEPRAMSDYIIERGNVVSYIDFHSFGQLWMTPFGGDCNERPADNEDILELALGASRALQHVHDRKYAVGAVCELIYQASGGSLDWTYARGGAKYSYAVELRDTGTHGFLLPPDEIVPTGEEALAAVLHLGEFIRQREKK
ncbi:hypothetical protein BC936DRAFT_139609 [Jimgerdemannia flammicorona]|uniref:Peptidase M14 domain-containing protein n=1 Tax=Jimgerdemannia flammicorona TaxID=994334 RepID=A0A433DHK7_9FUNG|nr:hypothetical protein BC936DRAFT_139609 [Jimgerdemannia flammicorona]